MMAGATPAMSMPVIVRLDRVTSTQAVAFDLAARGAADRTTVVAEHQTEGRGRRGRSWVDAPGASLLVSIVARPRLDAAGVPLLSYAAGVAVAEALAGTTGLAPRLKWPNDVLVGGRKIAGILLEHRSGVVAVGIGVNVGSRALPAELATSATSIALETGTAGDREALLAALLPALDCWRGRLEADGFAAVRQRWLALTETIGRDAVVDGLRGRAVDLDVDGALVLEADGRRHRVVAGELTR